jgi:hypothetical protein
MRCLECDLFQAAYKFALPFQMPIFLYSMHREPVIDVKTEYIEVRTAGHFNETLQGHLFLESEFTISNSPWSF